MSTRPGDALYRFLLRSFPRAFRARHGESMLGRFREQRERLQARPVAIVAFWVRAIVDVARHGLGARRDEWARRSSPTAGSPVPVPRSGAATLAFWSDLREACLGFRRDRGTTVVILAILTIGIAANATMFGVVDQLLLRPPAGVGHAEAVRRVWFGSEDPRFAGRASARSGYPAVAAVRDVPIFTAAAATSVQEVSVGVAAAARPAVAQLVDATYFTLLELTPEAGRFFAGSSASGTDAEPAAVLSHGFWHRVFGGDPRVIGQSLLVAGTDLTIVGVAPSGFVGLEDTPVDVWVPMRTMAPVLVGLDWDRQPGYYRFGLVARLAPGTSEAVVAAQATAAVRRLGTELPTMAEGGTAFVAPLARLRAPADIPDEGRVGLWLLGVATIVLLVAMANVAGLLTTRALARRRDIGVRLALGVSRARLLRQSLLESLLLAFAAGGAAIGVTYMCGGIAQQVLMPGFAWSGSVVDERVLGLALAVSVLTAVGASLAPAVQTTTTDLLASIRPAPRVTSGRAGAIRAGLLVAQIALCVVLLVGAGLFVRSMRALHGLNVGLDLDRVVQARLPELPGSRTADVQALYAAAADRVAALPGVDRVAVTRSSGPMARSSAVSILREGWTLEDTNGRPMPFNSVVTPEFFATVGATVTRGRSLTTDDDGAGTLVAVVNEALADDFFPGEDALGRCLHVGGSGPCTTIVGIVRNILQFDRTDTSQPHLYLLPSHPHGKGARPRGLLIRAADDASALVPRVREALQSLRPDLSYVDVATLADRTSPQLQPWRLGMTMFGAFGAVALVIAGVGLFSAMVHAVSLRSREIGIRVALGASAWHVVSQVTRQGALVIAVGTAIGLAAALVLARWLQDLLFQTSPRDPVVFAAVAGVLMTAGLLAAIVPARRSAAVDPLIALKAE